MSAFVARATFRRMKGVSGDEKGRLWQIEDPVSHTTWLWYDDADRVSGETQPDGKTLIVTYPGVAGTKEEVPTRARSWRV